MELDCAIQKYHWGKKGFKSLVAVLKHCGNPNYTINDNETYAELWMGTHSNGPSFVKKSNASLKDWIIKNPFSLGHTQDFFRHDIPFLFKILSIEMPLSLQVHPSKELAIELYAKYPKIYKDPNHKPELAIALSDFEVLCGFRPFEEIVTFFQSIPELVFVIGSDNVSNFINSNENERKMNLKKCFTSLMFSSDEIVSNQLNLLVNRLTNINTDTKSLVMGDLLIKINRYFPNDVGCFCIYFFNYLILKPGEAIFLDANEPHAYISGDCVECMACSDNVIRAGLTPKFRDVNTLCKIINYNFSSAFSKILNPINDHNNCFIYRPPVKEFAVRRVLIESGNNFNLKMNCPSIFIILNGSAKIRSNTVCKGQIFFLSANDELIMEVPKIFESVILYQAFVNI